MDFADRLRELMQSAGITNYRLSKIVGCSNSTVANWLAGKDITTEYQRKVADFFGVSVDYLLGNEEKPATSEDGGQKDIKDILLDVKSKAAQGITLMYNGKPINERTMRAFEASLEAAITLLDASQEE